MSDSNQVTDLQAVINTANLNSKPQQVRIGDRQADFVVIPENAKVHVLNQDLPPLEKRILLRFDELPSFIRYLKEHLIDETRVFAEISERGGEFLAVIDFHSKEKANTLTHRVKYGCPASTEWLIWNNSDKKAMEQSLFAVFLEENQVDVSSPAGADMLEIALTLEAKTSCEFSSGIKLQNGNVKLAFEETTNAKAGQKGDLEIPSSFTLHIPVFQGSSREYIDARLKYRISGGKASFWYELVRPRDIIRRACLQVISGIDEATGLQTFIGRIN